MPAESRSGKPAKQIYRSRLALLAAMHFLLLQTAESPLNKRFPTQPFKRASTSPMMTEFDVERLIQDTVLLQLKVDSDRTADPYGKTAANPHGPRLFSGQHLKLNHHQSSRRGTCILLSGKTWGSTSGC